MKIILVIECINGHKKEIPVMELAENLIFTCDICYTHYLNPKLKEIKEK